MRYPREALSPFLGPEFSPQEIKAVLDNCKLSYDNLRNGQIIERTAAALAKGQLVGWFQGRMEWAARALGNRSILASPVAPYVLENLNAFLKLREPHRTYSLAIRAEDLPRYFRGSCEVGVHGVRVRGARPQPASTPVAGQHHEAARADRG